MKHSISLAFKIANNLARSLGALFTCPAWKKGRRFQAVVLGLSVLLCSELVLADFNGNIVLGRPTDTSVDMNLLSYEDQQLHIIYGLERDALDLSTQAYTAAAEVPLNLSIQELSSDKEYFYQVVREQPDGAKLFSNTYSFRTQRAPGSTFAFGIQGDSHPEREPRDFNPDLYDLTLSQAASDGLDFYLTSGDDFSIDANYPEGIQHEDVLRRYRAQRPHLGIIGAEAPVFLVSGNHEQAALYLYQDEVNHPLPHNPAVWAQNARNEYFCQPEVNDFYTGNATELKYIDKGLHGSYYAWDWGDATFVVLDPFWTSPVAVDNVFGGGRGADATRAENKWDITLGDDQYQWFVDTLEQSDSKYKFVFAHMMHGASRGGVENAELYEWGGHSRGGQYEFDTERPNWDRPLHQLMVDTGVTIFFHAHDHLWVKQEMDGVVYQELGSPADDDYATSNWHRAYSHKSSVILPNSGYTRIEVSPEEVAVEYIRTFLPEDEKKKDSTSGSVAYRYVIPSP